MNLEQARVVLRRRSLGETLDLALRFVFGLDPRLYARLAALVLLPCLALCLGARSAGWEWGWVWVLAIGLGTLVQGVFTIVAGRLIFTERLTAREVLRQFALRLPTYAAALIASRLLLGLSALVVIPLPFAWIRLAYLHEAVLLENASVRGGFSRAARVVRRNQGTAALLLLALLCIQGGGLLMAELLGHGLVEFVLQSGRPLGSLFEFGGSLYALTGYFASVPLVATARFLSYTDARTRRDGWDIQVRFMSIRMAARQSA